MSEMLDFHGARDKVEQYIQGLLGEIPYDVGEAVRHACTNPGKLTRPLTTLAVAHDYGVPIDTALPYAASIQFAHEASLVFDDEMDKSPIRRGQLSCFNKFGSETARLAGIYLLKLGQHLISTGCATDSQKRRISYLDATTGMSLVIGQWSKKFGRHMFSIRPNVLAEKYLLVGYAFDKYCGHVVTASSGFCFLKECHHSFCQ